MDTAVQLFMNYGGLSVWLFITAPMFQVVKNFKDKIYHSGPRGTWFLLAMGSALFGLYMLMKSEYIVAAIQLIGLITSSAVLVQSFVYEHAN